MAITDLPNTLLVLSTGVTSYSARGLTQTLVPIRQSQYLERTINGQLDDLSLTQFQKYSSEITCKDQQAPALDGIWPGRIVTVSCVTPLSYTTVGGTPARPIVTGSSYVVGNFTFYRPILVMRIVSISLGLEEYQADYVWKLGLEEM